MPATFNGTWDWTAIGTLALALMTLVLASATLWMVMLARRSLAQTQDEIALSRREVEEAHRRVLVPYQSQWRACCYFGPGDDDCDEETRATRGATEQVALRHALDITDAL
jgi:hypothetical protein